MNQQNFCLHPWPSSNPNKKRKFKKLRVLPGRPKSQKETQDLGTPELQSKRRKALQKREKEALSLSALDVLYANSLIDKVQHQAGRSYGRLAVVAHKVIQVPKLRESVKEPFVGPRGKRSQIDSQNDRTDTEKKFSAIERKWRNCQAMLLKEGRSVFSTVNSVVIFEEVAPANVLVNFVLLERLRQGLSALDLYFKGSG